MSVDATIWAWKSPVQSSAQRVVLLSMADRAGEGHTCYPSVSRLAQDCCLDRKTVMRAIDQLEQLGLVRDTGSIRGNGVKVYQLIGVTGREDVPRTEKTTSTKSGTSTKNDTSTKIGTATSTKNGTSTSTKNGTQNLPIESISEPNNNIKRSDIAKTNKFDFKAKLIENGVSEKLATEFMQVRKAKGGVNTERAFSLLSKQIEKANLNFVQAIEFCLNRQKPWAAFEAQWYFNEQNRSSQPQQTNQPYQRRFGNSQSQAPEMRDVTGEHA